MAPSSRGRPSRGTSRGRRRVRGEGRGKGTYAATHSNKPIFYSTRVEEQVQSDAEASEIQAVEEKDEQDPSSGNEDGEKSGTTAHPYSVLLQSLNTNNNTQRGSPKRKKRKLDGEGLNRLAVKETLEEQLAENVLEDAGSSSSGESSPDEETESQDGNQQGYDPFNEHVADPNEAQLERAVQEVEQGKYHTLKSNLQSGFLCSLMIPESHNHPSDASAAFLGRTEDFPLKQRLRAPAAKLLPFLTDACSHLARSIFDYQDVLFSERTLSNAEDLRKLICLHSINHIFKTRHKVIKNNARIMKENSEEDIELRDQGFTRPKVLIVLPTKQACVRYVELLVALCEPEQQENKKRFLDLYAHAAEELSEDKPEDFRELFSGNDDDLFRLGMKFTRKTIKYFSQFYSSDIIFASPLGLRMAIGEAGSKKKDHDFLSSIEILIIDQADSLSMQNWEHVEYVFEHLNLQPKEAHGCDFSRVKSWYLNGHAKFVRQTVLFSAFNFPALNWLYLRQMLNIAGKVKYKKPCEGAMLDLGCPLKQTFSRFGFVTPVTEPDERFNYFTTGLVPLLLKQSNRHTGGKQGVLVYLPSYADFVRVRNHLSTSPTTQNISFGAISEYTSVQEVARARSHFFSGRHSVLLYTERAHHFRRYRLRGVNKVIMYGLPENPIFYREIVAGYLGASLAEGKVTASEAGVRSLFSRLDMLKLERIVGTKRVPSLMKEKLGDTFDFV
ncbi:MAG: hypothetical protein Q9191_000989 [Dirinaria sp. TL-2023a]